MTQKIWEKQLARQLADLPKPERKQVLDYYREMYGDKIEAGFSEEAILAEFGSPQQCAHKILASEGLVPAKVRRQSRRTSPAAIVGIFFLTLIIILPLASTAFALIVTFFALSVSGIAVAIAGAIYAIGAPLLVMDTLAAAGILAHFGLGIATCGVGLLLFVAFKPLTKYLAIGTGKALAFIYHGRF